MRSYSFLLAALLLSACSTGSSQVESETLEAFAVTATGVEAEYEEISAQGLATVGGEGRDVTLNIATDGSAIDLAIHTPGEVDLSELSGREISAELSYTGLHNERSVVLSDEAGPVYVADDGWHRSQMEEIFGAGFVDWGDTLSTDIDESYNWAYTDAVFQGDDGPVHVAPGQTANVSFDGQNWAVTVLAAYTVDPHPNAALPCGGISDLVTYEMKRVEQPTEPRFQLRPADQDIAHLGCL